MTADAPHSDDAELVRRARAGNARARNALVRRHLGAVYRTALGVLKDESRAEDATQETFLKAFRALDGFRGDSAFRTWLLAIAANEAQGILRSLGRRREVALDDTAVLPSGNPRPDRAVIEREEAGRVRACLDTLPEKQRLAVQLRVFEEMSFREIGRAIDSSEGAARVNYHHGIRKLREMME